MKPQISADFIKKLHFKYSPNGFVFDLVFNHCKIVSEIALQLINNYKNTLDKDLIITGSLLHDIGAYRLSDKSGKFDKNEYLKHGIYGSEILRNENLPESICLIAERHTGVGITKEEIVNNHLPLPPRDFLAVTPEEQLIMYADKFHSKTPKFNSFEVYKMNISKFGVSKVKKFEAFSKLFGIPDLNKLSINYSMPII